MELICADVTYVLRLLPILTTYRDTDGYFQIKLNKSDSLPVDLEKTKSGLSDCLPKKPINITAIPKG